MGIGVKSGWEPIFPKMVSVHADAVGDIYTVVRPDGSYIKFTWISGWRRHDPAVETRHERGP